MAKVLVVNDLHLSDKAPSSCTDSYLDDLFELIRACNKLALDQACAAIAQAGDLLHIKTGKSNSHWLMQRIIEVFLESVAPWLIVPGNHDLLHNRQESLFDGQPLGVILRSGAAHLLSGWVDSPTWPTEIPAQAKSALKLPLYGVAWLQNWNQREHDREAAHKAVEAATCDLHGENYEYRLVVAHAPFYRPGTELEWENYPTSAFASYLPSGTSVAYGHVHEPHGVYETGGVTFCNAGAISRGSLHEYNLTREIQCAIWDSVTGQFTLHTLPHKPASEVFKIQEAQTKKKTQLDLDEFLTSIGHATIEVTSIEAVLAHVRTLDLSTEVFSLVEELLQGAS